MREDRCTLERVHLFWGPLGAEIGAGSTRVGKDPRVHGAMESGRVRKGIQRTVAGGPVTESRVRGETPEGATGT